MKTTEREIDTCKCGHKCASNGEPVTVGGWHGDIEYRWGRVGGVSVVRAIRYRCPVCKIDWAGKPGFDRPVVD